MIREATREQTARGQEYANKMTQVLDGVDVQTALLATSQLFATIAIRHGSTMDAYLIVATSMWNCCYHAYQRELQLLDTPTKGDAK